MNFLYMAYGVAMLLAMLLCMFVLTLLGNVMLSKDQLNNVITPLFFIGLAVVGLLNLHKAPEKRYINALLLSLILVAIMGVFIYISGHIPKSFHVFMITSFLSLQLGSVIYFIASKLKKINAN